jgi:hypothetical protein
MWYPRPLHADSGPNRCSGVRYRFCVSAIAGSVRQICRGTGPPLCARGARSSSCHSPHGTERERESTHREAGGGRRRGRWRGESRGEEHEEVVHGGQGGARGGRPARPRPSPAARPRQLAGLGPWRRCPHWSRSRSRSRRRRPRALAAASRSPEPPRALTVRSRGEDRRERG